VLIADLATGMWQSRATMPFASEAPSGADGIYGLLLHEETPAAGLHLQHCHTPGHRWLHTGWDHYGSASGGSWKVSWRGADRFQQRGNRLRCSDQHVVAGTERQTTSARGTAVGQFLYVVAGSTQVGLITPRSGVADLCAIQGAGPDVPFENERAGVWT